MRDRRTEQVWLTLIDAAHHETDSIERRLNRYGVINVDRPPTRAIAERACERGCALATSSSHDNAAKRVGREVSRDPSAHRSVSTDDQYVLLCHHAGLIHFNLIPSLPGGGQVVKKKSHSAKPPDIALCSPYREARCLLSVLHPRLSLR